MINRLLKQAHTSKSWTCKTYAYTNLDGEMNSI